MTQDEKSWLKPLPNDMSAVTEGSAEILFDKDSVFYNPIQQFNRDMSVAAIKVWSQNFLQGKRKKMEKKNSSNCSEEASSENAVKEERKEEQEVWFNVSDKLSDKQKQRKLSQLKCMKQAASKLTTTEPIDVEDMAYDGLFFTILEALAASGLRSIRYAKEIPKVRRILTNDLSSEAVHSIERNARHNGVEKIITPNKGDANQTFYKLLGEGRKYDVVDLDPYGSAAPFLDAAIQTVSDGGLLCVTCTDLAVLAGSQPESCFGKYGGINVPNSSYTHELALRILLHSIQSTAAKYRRGIEVLMSCHIDYYVRVFVVVRHSATLMKEASSKTAMLNACVVCGSFKVQPLGKLIKTAKGSKYGPAQCKSEQFCSVCTSQTHIAGPFYSAPIHNETFLLQMIRHLGTDGKEQYGTWERMAGMVVVMQEELEDCPLYLVLPKMCNVIHSSTPSLPVFMYTFYMTSFFNFSRAGLLSTGYRASQSHACQQAIKTDAPQSVVWDVLKKWVNEHAPLTKVNEKSPGAKIMGVESSTYVFPMPSNPI